MYTNVVSSPSNIDIIFIIIVIITIVIIQIDCWSAVHESWEVGDDLLHKLNFPWALRSLAHVPRTSCRLEFEKCAQLYSDNFINDTEFCLNARLDEMTVLHETRDE